MPPGDVMEPLPESAPPGWSFPFMPQDCEHTPAAVQAYVHNLQDEATQLRERVEALEARLTQNSTTSHRPPSSDSPYKKPRQRPTTATSRKVGGQPGHPGIARCSRHRPRSKGCDPTGSRVPTR